MALANAARGWLEMEGFLFTVFLTILYIIVSIILIIVGINGKKDAENNTYVTTNATITEQINCRPGKCRKYDRYSGRCTSKSPGSCLCIFTYYVSGNTYTGQITMSDKYSIGDQITIEYDPTNPANYREGTLSKTGAIVMIVFGAIAGAIGLGYGVCATKEGCRSTLGVVSVLSPKNTGNRIVNGFGSLSNFMKKFK
jgi:hypothetical protein